MDFQSLKGVFTGSNGLFHTYVAVAAAFPILALIFSVMLQRKIRSYPTGEAEMRRIWTAIRRGAGAFLRTEYSILVIFVILLGGVLLRFIDWPATHPAQGASFDFIKALGNGTAICFLTGAFCSALAGFIGMRAATSANVRTAFAARSGLGDAFRIAFSSGSVTGMTVVGLGLLGIIALFLWQQSADGIFGFSLGASSIALFARVGGGIFTKAADVGADLVGKVESGIPEDDPRNPASIADSVGDNVGDVAGMGADLFESYVGSVIAAMALGALLIHHAKGSAEHLGKFHGNALVFLPIGLAAIGIFASIFGTFVVRTDDESRLHAALFKGLILSSVIFAVLAFGLVYALDLFNNQTFSAVAFTVGSSTTATSAHSIASTHFHGPGGILWAILSGLALGVIIGKVTEYYTSEQKRHAQAIAKQSETGVATNIIHGIAVGMQSTAAPVFFIAVAIFVAYYFAGLYGVGVSAVGMLSTLGISLGIDAYGPVADNAGGIAEMSHCSPETRARTDALDAAGNTTAAIGKGFAIGSAALTALALFTTYANQYKLLHGDQLKLDILLPRVTAGLLLGGILPFLFSALTMKAVGRAANRMITEVRRQFRTIPGIMEGTGEPQYGRCVSIATRGALVEMLLPGIVAIVAPLSVGIVLGPAALGGLLAGSLITAVLMAIFMANAGGAWDNAKKWIEKGNLGGKGSEIHKAAVVGDTVGDPFKDTAGPSLNILIKLMAIVSLIFIPVFIKFGPLI